MLWFIQLSYPQATSSMVDVDVHELLDSLQCLAETKPTKFNFLTLMKSVKSIMDIEIEGSDAKVVLSNLLQATAKLGVTLEHLSIEGSKLVDISCRQLSNNRWVDPTSEEWKALNIERMTFFFPATRSSSA